MSFTQTEKRERPRRIGYWPLRSDAGDALGGGRDGIAEHVRFEDSAIFDGVTSTIRLPGAGETDGSQPFSLSLEFEVDDQGGSCLPGGLVSRYCEERMEGWHLSVLSQPGVTSAQTNWRNLQFGWTAERAVGEWKDWGSPGGSRMICSMCVFDDSLYVGIFDDAQDRKGHVYSLTDEGEWFDCGHPDDSNSVWSLAEFGGRLYAGTMRYKASGSALPESPNQAPGGRIFRYEGGQEWSLFGELPVEGNDSIGALTVFGDRLVAMPFYSYGAFAFDESGRCEPLGAPGSEGKTRGFTLSPFQRRLYIGCNYSDGVWSRTLTEPWRNDSVLKNCDQVYCFAVYHNRFLTGIWPEARVLCYEGGVDWSDYGLLGAEKEVMGVSVFNGRLYGGTLPGGEVYRYAGDRRWEKVGVLESPELDVVHRRVWTMAVYRGSLFAGTLPSGKVWSLGGVPLVTSDRSLTPGWHRATVTYNRETLALYLDGRLVSEAPVGGAVDPLSGDVPLMLGSGPQCKYSGRIREAELYDGALTAGQIADLSRKS
ncbi:LamG domain-containing protein [Paenibacillus eucommiae]|uniref:LamG domain-containing protein n=1 Tax=Paenibacillus eucommiae TaxID=1355755 RepID=A0ABS4J6Q1_9BACL|nr:LamG domain-containing protein [Paenibacillus eucommiae]MBP1994936.1 hypothetical protein [Paenibacillus eucommiae]